MIYEHNLDKDPAFPPPSETKEVLTGNDIIIKKTLETFSSIKEKIIGSLDNAGVKPILTGLVQLKEKGVPRCIRVQYI